MTARRYSRVLVAQAHSFAQQARLAITLAWIAGYTNIITIIVCASACAHVSGTTSLLGEFAARGDWGSAAFTLFVLLAFLVGAIIAGIAMESGKRRGWESIYVVPIAIETSLLLLFALGLEWVEHDRARMGAYSYIFLGLAGTAMGLQNATITSISSGAVRTTHVTGVLTDLGTEIARLASWAMSSRRSLFTLENISLQGFSSVLAAGLRRAQAEQSARRIALLASIVGSFALGAALGTLAYQHVQRLSMFPPVIFLLWLIWVDVHRPIAEIEPSDLVQLPDLQLPPTIGVFSLARKIAASGRVLPNRMPNLLAWLDRLPTSVRVIVLDLHGVLELDDNAAGELCAAMAHARHDRRRMIIAGLSQSQFAQLHRVGGSDAPRPEDATPDLEFALARALGSA